MDRSVRIISLDTPHLDAVAPLWRELLDHVAGLPGGAGVPVRSFEQSWPMERRFMEEALQNDGFVLAATRGETAIGYAFVTIEGADPVWYTGERCAELVHLVVTAAERRSGVGSALMDAVDAELERLAVDDVQFGVDRGNHEAMRFYERRGYQWDFHIYYGSPGRRPWACRARDEADRRAGRGRYAPSGPEVAPAPHATSGPAPDGVGDRAEGDA